MLNMSSGILIVAAVMLSAVNGFDLNEIATEPRIVNGKNSTRGQFPFYAFLKIKLTGGTASCGGSLISNEWVVSAAHCLQGASSVEVHLGSLRASNLTEEGRIIVNVTKTRIHVHPKYDQEKVLNDIGLIHLPEPIEISETIQPVKLAHNVRGNLNVVAIGNGVLNTTDKTIAPILQHANLTITSWLRCQLSFPFLMFRKSVICAKGNEKQSVCFGDSGGPLIDKNDRALVGVASFVNGFGCNHGFPQGFTNIPSYIYWIKTITGISEYQENMNEI